MTCGTKRTMNSYVLMKKELDKVLTPRITYIDR